MGVETRVETKNMFSFGCCFGRFYGLVCCLMLLVWLGCCFSLGFFLSWFAAQFSELLFSQVFFNVFLKVGLVCCSVLWFAARDLQSLLVPPLGGVVVECAC